MTVGHFVYLAQIEEDVTDTLLWPFCSMLIKEYICIDNVL